MKTVYEDDFITVTEKLIEVVEVKTSAVANAIQNYLDQNLVGGEQYEFSAISPKTTGYHIHLIDKVLRCEPDECFESDDNWEDFCKELAEKTRQQSIKVPYWYYPK